MEGLSKLVQPFDCYSLLFFHVAISDTATGYLESIKSDYRALQAVDQGMGAQVVSSILLVREKGMRRRALVVQVANWLWSWCWRQSFGFYDPGTMFIDQRLLGRDGIHLTKWGKATSENRWLTW